MGNPEKMELQKQQQMQITAQEQKKETLFGGGPDKHTEPAPAPAELEPQAGDETVDRFTDMVLQAADDQDLYCARCIHRTGDLLSCVKYLEKPGSVVYGGPCKFFQEA